MRAKSTLGVLLGGLILLLVGFLTRNIPTKADTPRRGATQSKVPKARKAPKALRSPAESPESPTKPPLALATASFRDLPQAIRRAARERQAIRKKPAIPAPPVSLTATDGTGLRLLSLGARAAIEGPLALTELRLAFENPRPRTIEGRFEITLPTGAAISRFAMRLPSGWQEAEVVERQAAHQAYESYLHLNQDPALLEKKAGNTFRARVFPIPPRGVKELIISYSQRLSGKQPTYKLRLRGLPKLRRLSVTVTWGQREQKPARSSLGGISLASRVTRVTKSDYRPVTDFTLPIPALGDGLRHGNLVVARVTPPLPTTLAAASFTGLAVLIDTSASRAAGLGAQVETLRALIATLAKGHGEHLPLEIAAFDQGIEPIYRGTLGGFDRAAAARILLRRGLGASNLHGALTWAQNLRGVDRLLVITDGLATAGPTQTRALRAAAKELPQAIQRLDVLLVGGSHDRQAMRRLVTGTRHDDGAVIDAETPTVQIARRLDQITLSGVEIRIPGARWVWPSVLDGLQPGQTALVYADVPKLPSAHPLDIHLSGRVTQHVQLQLKTAPRPLVARACAQARIERLEARRDALTSETKGSVDAQLRALTRRIVALSTRYRVLSDATAMIVLENDAAYRRFHISRRALAGILTVDPYGVQILNRKTIVTAPPQQRFNGRNAGLLRFLRASPVNAYGLGGLGLTGTGRGGGATATGS
ncbi:MAG: hypothetical protein KAI47_20655, partial [Deltaproteobacteria bacterium]|nr:hypothetical protein [Deltaproteobacteria bacterium]